MDTLRQDLRTALRSLRQSPGFAAAFVITLGVAIGAAAAVLSATRLSLFDPLPFPDPHRLVEIWETGPNAPRRPVAPANFLDWQRQAASFESMAVYRVVSVNASAPGGAPENLPAAIVSGEFFATLRPRLLQGRPLGPEDTGSESPVVVVGRDLAVRQFGSVDAALGSTLDIDRRAHEVVGVVAGNVDYPDGAEVWTPAPNDIPPIGLPGVDPRTVRDARYLGAVARLAPSVAEETARGEMETVAARLRSAHPLDNEGSGIGIQALARGVVASVRPMLLALGSSVALLLGVACANIGGLVLARAAERRGEIALRTALGASGSRVARQLVTELGLLVAMAGLVAIATGTLAIAALRATLPPDTPRLAELGLDGGLLAACLLLAAAIGAMLAVVPGRIAGRTAPAEALHSLGRGGMAGARAGGMRLLVSAQFALAVAVVAAAGLLLTALGRLGAVDPGFETLGRVTLRVHLPGADSVPAATNAAALREITAALATLPGVDTAAAGLVSLLREGPGAGFRIEGGEVDGNPPNIQWTLVSDGYFRALGIPLRQGRPFAAGDDERNEPVAVLNETAARRFFPAGDAVGRRVRTGLDGDSWVRVVGVVGDTRDRGLDAPPPPRMYRPLAQPTRWNPTAAQIVLATTGPAPDATALRRTVDGVFPGAPVTRVGTAGGEVLASFGDRSTVARTGSALALAALALAAMGVHAVLRRSVAARRGEIAVRLSIGATPRNVLGGVLRDAFLLAGAGLVVGAPLALGTTHLLRDLLYGIDAASPLVHGTAILGLLAVALLAALAPARDAARTDPMISLRNG